MILTPLSNTFLTIPLAYLHRGNTFKTLERYEEAQKDYLTYLKVKSLHLPEVLCDHAGFRLKPSVFSLQPFYLSSYFDFRTKSAYL